MPRSPACPPGWDSRSGAPDLSPDLVPELGFSTPGPPSPLAPDVAWAGYHAVPLTKARGGVTVIRGPGPVPAPPAGPGPPRPLSGAWHGREPCAHRAPASSRKVPAALRPGAAIAQCPLSPCPPLSPEGPPEPAVAVAAGAATAACPVLRLKSAAPPRYPEFWWDKPDKSGAFLAKARYISPATRPAAQGGQRAEAPVELPRVPALRPRVRRAQDGGGQQARDAGADDHRMSGSHHQSHLLSRPAGRSGGRRWRPRPPR